jgi:hypothetical protein
MRFLREAIQWIDSISSLVENVERHWGSGQVSFITGGKGEEEKVSAMILSWGHNPRLWKGFHSQEWYFSPAHQHGELP